MSAPPVVILAGGTSRRMGGQDKSLAMLNGVPLIRHVLDRVTPQGGAVAINSPSDEVAAIVPGHDLLPDHIPDRRGPLAGILTAMHWARDHDFVITVPADAPFLPGDLIPRLILASGNPAQSPAIAACGGRAHPVCGLWPVVHADALATAIQSGTRKVMDWTDSLNTARADFPATDPDPFFNVNTPDDLMRAQQYLDQAR